jgi:hypothetical protein
VDKALKTDWFGLGCSPFVRATSAAPLCGATVLPEIAIENAPCADVCELSHYFGQRWERLRGVRAKGDSRRYLESQHCERQFAFRVVAMSENELKAAFRLIARNIALEIGMSANSLLDFCEDGGKAFGAIEHE